MWGGGGSGRGNGGGVGEVGWGGGSRWGNLGDQWSVPIVPKGAIWGSGGGGHRLPLPPLALPHG